jgi:hypothetical protein
MTKRIFTLIMFFPIVGIITPYVYVGCSMLILKKFNVYSSDPKSLGINLFYEIALFFSMIGLIIIGLGVILILYRLIFNQIKVKDIYGKYIFLLGLLLTIFLHYFDPGNYLNWFFD